MEEGSIVAAFTAMAFVVVGVFQYLKGYITSSQKDYTALREKYEALQAKNTLLETNNLLWKNKAMLWQRKAKRLKTQLDQCSETIQAALNKTRPISADTLDQLDVDDTVPE